MNIAFRSGLGCRIVTVVAGVLLSMTWPRSVSADPPEYADCEIPGYKFLEAAEAAGWTVEAEVKGGEGGCSYLNKSIVASPAAGAKKVVCNIKFFANGSIASPWKFSKATFSGGSWKFLSTSAALPTNKPSLDVELSINNGQSVSFSLAKAVLTHDGTKSCDDWGGSIGN